MFDSKKARFVKLPGTQKNYGIYNYVKTSERDVLVSPINRYTQ